MPLPPPAGSLGQHARLSSTVRIRTVLRHLAILNSQRPAAECLSLRTKKLFQVQQSGHLRHLAPPQISATEEERLQKAVGLLAIATPVRRWKISRRH